MNYLKKYWYIVVLIVIGIGAMIAVIIQNNQPQPPIAENSQATNTPPVIIPTTTPEVIMSDVDTSGWKTYRNEEYGFEFRYPKDWRFINIDTIGVGLLPSGKQEGVEYNGDMTLILRNNQNQKTIDEFYNGTEGSELFKSAIGGYNDITIQNKKGIIFNNVMGLYPDANVIIIPLQNKFLEITTIENHKISNKILDTIRFE